MSYDPPATQVRVKELVDILLTMPQDAILLTYHLGNYPDVTSVYCKRFGGDDTYVELNLDYYEP